ncbi:membrane protein insertase YidC, partial [Betaproteobacteria bacterium]|nr:membrane protein insertase YidC [Betaproteobacteria bacterium]
MKFRTTVLLIIFSFTLLLLWDEWISYNTKTLVVPETGVTKQINTPNSEEDEYSSDLPSINKLEARKTAPVEKVANNEKAGDLLVLETSKLKIIVNTFGGTLEYAELKDQKSEEYPDGRVILFDKSNRSVYLAETGLISLGSKREKLPDHLTLFEVESKDSDKVSLIANKNGVSFTKTFTILPNSYVVEVTHDLVNNANKEIKAGLYYQLSRDSEPPLEGSSFYNTYTGPVIYTESRKFEKVPFSDIEESKQEHVQISNDGWFGIIQHYYVGAWIFKNDLEREFYTKKLKNNKYSVGAIQLTDELQPSQGQTFTNLLYIGPQYQEDLKKIEKGLDLVVDYGMLTIIAKPIFWLLDKLYNIVGNWGWAIVCLTIIIKLLFFPLTAASYKSMAKMKAVTPKIMKIREQFKENKMQLNNAMMDLYKKEKINPLGGCLPILIQIPVFIALYW